MFDFIQGQIVDKNPAYVVLDCNGIGYMIHISINTYSKLSDKKQCRLLTHFVVREDAQLLYGFYEQEERHLFRLLITVSGVGANTARMILSSLSPDEIVQAIIGNDISLLQSVKGIGAKSAQRIIIELKDKIGKSGISQENLNIPHNTKKDEALSALIMLGFTRNIAEKAINKIFISKGSAISVEQLIKEALKIL
ncbi:Holliday junction branch migration protein RuvA [Bacteroidota bacterium]